MSITFCVVCHNFQWRLCWQLSSILQQEGQIPPIRIDIASMANNGSPHITEEIIEKFQDFGLDITHRIYDDRDRFAKRGLIRNDQLSSTKEDWIFFADCDNVYPVNFFANLWKSLQNENKECTKVITSSAKHHTCAIETQKLLETRNNDIIIDNAFDTADNLKTIRKRNRKIAAGGMQVINTKVVDRYVNERRCKDRHLFEQRQGARSDIQFRRSVGGSQLIKLGYQIHLNHRRDKEEGKHLEEQR